MPRIWKSAPVKLRFGVADIRGSRKTEILELTDLMRREIIGGEGGDRDRHGLYVLHSFFRGHRDRFDLRKCGYREGGGNKQADGETGSAQSDSEIELVIAAFP